MLNLLKILEEAEFTKNIYHNLHIKTEKEKEKK
jgi:hypothetical protein